MYKLFRKRYTFLIHGSSFRELLRFYSFSRNLEKSRLDLSKLNIRKISLIILILEENSFVNKREREKENYVSFSLLL